MDKVHTKIIIDNTSDGGNYISHRIPGIVVTKKDTVIIYCEARTDQNGNYAHLKSGCGQDWNLMDIYIRRSVDGGHSFDDPIYIAIGTNQHKTVNNPVMIVGGDNTLHFLFCKNYGIESGGLWYTKSTDDGLTWSDARNVSEYASSKVDFDCFAFGPTHGICATNGRLIVPVWYVPKGKGAEITSHIPSKTAVFYSDDNGLTWNLSEDASLNSDETAVVELSNGDIMLNSRHYPYRAITVSKDGITNWSETFFDEQLPDPACCGGLIKADLCDSPSAILFVNCSNNIKNKDDNGRHSITVKCSYDDGNTYSKQVKLTENIGGYSDIAVNSKGKVFVIYEENYGEKIHLACFAYKDFF